MKVLYRTFPNGFMTGVVPLSCYPSPPSSGRKKSSRQHKEQLKLCNESVPCKDSLSFEGKSICNVIIIKININ